MDYVSVTFQGKEVKKIGPTIQWQDNAHHTAIMTG
jgi:hypothetical protein